MFSNTAIIVFGDIMNIRISKHFTYKKLLKFTVPSMIMMIFTSVYGVVDGFFVSNFVGKTPFAAVNFIMPYLMLLGCIGFMFGTGGSAIIAKTIGEGNREKANSYFSMLIYVSLFAGTLITIFGIIYLPEISYLLGARGELLSDCVLYGRINLLALPFFILQLEFQSFFITAGKPQLGLLVTIVSGVANMVLDYLLVGTIKGGLIGAAAATGISQVIGGAIPLFYFFTKNNSLLKLGKTKFELKPLIKTCTNGSSELVTNLSMSLIGMLYNIQLMKYIGENGIAAYGVIMYVNFVFVAAFIGYSIGTAPIISYNYGAKNNEELKNVLKKSLIIILVLSISMVLASVLLARPLSSLFVGYDKELTDITVRGFYFFSASFAFSGYAIYASGFFTALNDGLTSALISLLRTLVFQVAAVMLLPLILEVDGIWLSVVIAEFMSVALGAVFLFAKKNKYKYL